MSRHFRKRLYTVCHGPYRSGSSLHGAPPLAIHSIPFIALRLSHFAGRPRFPCFGCSGGSISLIRFHSLSVSSYRFIPIGIVYINLPFCATFIFQTRSNLFRNLLPFLLGISTVSDISSDKAKVPITENSDNTGQAMTSNILLDIAGRLLGFPQAPDRTLCVRSNTPYGVAFSLPLVARSRTSAREYQCPVRIPFRTVWGSRKPKGSSGVYRHPGLADHSQCRSPPSQNRRDVLQIREPLLWQG